MFNSHFSDNELIKSPSFSLRSQKIVAFYQENQLYSGIEVLKYFLPSNALPSCDGFLE